MKPAAPDATLESMNAPGEDPQLFIQRYRDTVHSRDASISETDRVILEAILLAMRLAWSNFNGTDDLNQRAFPE